MKRIIGCLILILLSCLVLVPIAFAGQLENDLIIEAINGKANAVRTLIDKGADVNAKDDDGETALMLAAYYGYADVVRVLIEKGADVGAMNKDGGTALDEAEAMHKTGVADMLRAAMSSSVARMANPQEKLNQYISELRKNPHDQGLRKQIILFANAMKPAPAIPDDAQRSFFQGNTIMKAAKNTSDYKLAIDKYNEALIEAPWWEDAYYNIAMAESSAGMTDDAKKNLQLYIFTKPKDVAQAQNKIYEIEAQQELQEQRKVAMEAKYGERQNGKSANLDDLYRHGAIVKNMSFDASGNERTISLKIVTEKENGLLRNYLNITDITDRHDLFGHNYSMDLKGTQSFYLRERTKSDYIKLTVTSYGDGDAKITVEPAMNASASIQTSLTALLKERASQAVYAGKVLSIGGKDFYCIAQGGHKGAFLYFPLEIKDLLESGSASDLMPVFVAYVNHRESDKDKNYTVSDLGVVNGTHYHLELIEGNWQIKVGQVEDH